MRKNRLPQSGLIVVGILVQATWNVGFAVAQPEGRVRYNRPADTSASGQLGRVGGTFTGSAYSPLSTIRSGSGGTNLSGRNAPSGVTRRLPTTGSLGMRLLQQQSGGATGAAVGSASVATRFRNRAIDPSQLTYQDIALASGFAHQTRMDSPLRGWRFVPQRPASPLHPMADPAKTDFQRYFGLRPAELAEPEQSSTSLPEALQGEVDKTVSQIRARALRAFKEGRYGEAATLLDAVRRSEPNDYEASLLAAHAALEQQQPSLAIKCIVEAAQRNPRLFKERFDFRKYYRDARTGEVEMRMAANTATVRNTWPALILGTYATWQLSEDASARHLLNQLMQLKSDQSENTAAMIRIFISAARVILE